MKFDVRTGSGSRTKGTREMRVEGMCEIDLLYWIFGNS